MSEENVPITNKEKMLVKTLVKLYSKERLEDESKELDEIFSMDSPLVIGAAKLLGINRGGLRNIGTQYLNYAIKNYEDIRKNIFPSEIERVVEAYFYAEETEMVEHFITRRVEYFLLPSKYESTEKFVYDNFFEFDPYTVNTDYGDSDFSNLKPLKKQNVTANYSRNVLD